MKLLKSLAISSAALACVSFASAADVELWITGATAYRQSVHAAIVSSLTPTTCQVGYDTASPGVGGAKFAVFKGTLKSTADVPAGIRGKTAIIRTSWNGSAAGVQAVSQVSPVVSLNFLADSAASGGFVSVSFDTPDANGNQRALYTDSDGGNVGNPGQATSVTHAANLAFHDVGQASTIFPAGTNTYVINSSGTTADRTYDELTQQTAGVVGFSWIRSASTDAGLTTAAGAISTVGTSTPITGAFSNINVRQARLAIASGTLGLGFFTGVGADTTNYDVFMTGRNADSGTRIVVMSEAFIDPNANPTHYLAAANGTNITGVSLYPAETIQGVFFAAGTSGESSGATLVTKIKQPVLTGGRKFLVLSYASIADITAVANSAQNWMLTYNGERYSDNNVRNGKYSLWGKEQMSYNEVATDNRFVNKVGALSKTFADYLLQPATGPVSEVWSELSGVRLSTMVVDRSQEGADIF